MVIFITEFFLLHFEKVAFGRLLAELLDAEGSKRALSFKGSSSRRTPSGDMYSFQTCACTLTLQGQKGWPMRGSIVEDQHQHKSFREIMLDFDSETEKGSDFRSSGIITARTVRTILFLGHRKFGK